MGRPAAAARGLGAVDTATQRVTHRRTLLSTGSTAGATRPSKVSQQQRALQGGLLQDSPVRSATNLLTSLSKPCPSTG
jgi:hypothetical protein